MNISYLTSLPQFQKLSQEKKEFLIQFASTNQTKGSQKDISNRLMQAITLARSKNISFTQEESMLLIQVIKQDLSPEDAKKADKMIQMMQQFRK